MTEIIQSIMDTVDKKKVQSLCKKVLKNVLSIAVLILRISAVWLIGCLFMAM